MSDPEQPADPWAAVPKNSAPPSPPASGYGYPPPGMPPSYYPPVQTRRTNSMATASLVCGVCGFICLVPGILGIIFGFIALGQIKREGTQGRGMAIAGIITGAIWPVLAVTMSVLMNTVSN